MLSEMTSPAVVPTTAEVIESSKKAKPGGTKPVVHEMRLTQALQSKQRVVNLQQSVNTLYESSGVLSGIKGPQTTLSQKLRAKQSIYILNVAQNH